MISRLDAVSKDGRANISGRWAANLTQSIEIKPFDELQDPIANMRHLTGRRNGGANRGFRQGVRDSVLSDALLQISHSGRLVRGTPAESDSVSYEQERYDREKEHCRKPTIGVSGPSFIGRDSTNI